MSLLSPLERDLIALIAPAPMLEQVCAWSAINTGTRNLDGLARQAGLLADAFVALPGDVTLEQAAPVEAVLPDGRVTAIAHGCHLVLRVRPRANRRFLLTGHMDTVFAADHPFQATRWIDDHTLNGPGVADMKGGIAVMLAALTAFENGPHAAGVGYDVLINADEETGSLSSAPLIAHLANGKAAALTFEPSALPDGTLAGARAGSGNYSVVIHGRSAHAGRNPEDGRNAIVAAARLVVALAELAHPELSVNPAKIEGGSANNVVPDLAVVRFNIRPRDEPAAICFGHDLRSLLAWIESEYGVTTHVHGGLSRPPKPLTPDAERLFHLVRDCGAALGQTIAWQSSGGVCDGNNIAACGVPVVDTMGVRGGAIHSDQEFLIVPSLAERAALAALVLHRLSGENQ
ncbi:hydrolase [Novosphingobium sp.]|uniref:hydrolase n=1 Tax=Novosphingobium sp. TaxID=1874826 RepID=UPI00333E8F01